MHKNGDTPIIELRNVNFIYDEGKPNAHSALQDINLKIYPGEYVSFLGPSGCGKSTLLYVIAGIDKPSSGQVLINGRDITTMSGKELSIYRQIGIGIIFQNFNLIPSISVEENITMPMAFLGVNPKIRREKADEILKRLDIGPLGDRFPFELSGGQQQRVGIARALINEPPLMLADEPLGNLDSENANKVLDFLKELNETYRKTVIMVTHEEWSLRDVGRIYHMLDGKITGIEDTSTGTISGNIATNPIATAKNPEERAKAMSGLLLRGYLPQEIERLETYLLQLFQDKIDIETFVADLDKPFKEGGVGLWKQKAKKIGTLVESVISEKENLENIYNTLKTSPQAHLYDEIRDIRTWILSDEELKLNSLQHVQLDEIIGERIRGIIPGEHFLQLLNLSKKEGGLGFAMRTAMKLSEKMEVLLGSDADTNK